MNEFMNDESFDDYEPPRWLHVALDGSNASPQFLQKCEQAALIAHALGKMRREHSKAKYFVDLPLPSYVEGIARLASADLAPVLSWLGVPDLAHLDSSTIRGAVRLCKEMGMTFREMLAHVRIGFAETQGFGPFSLVLARRGQANRLGGLEYYEEVLTNLERDYPESAIRQLRDLEHGIQSGYTELD